MTATLFVTGFWGIATYKLKNKMFVSVFGLATVAMAVILTACAAIFNALANLSDEQMNAVCPFSASASGTTDSNAVITSFEPLEDVEDAVKEIDSLNELSSYYMCSPTCPCLKPADSTINGWTDEENWFNIEEKDLIKYERTKETIPRPFFNPILFLDSKEEADEQNLQTFDTFEECADAIVAKTWLRGQELGLDSAEGASAEVTLFTTAGIEAASIESALSKFTEARRMHTYFKDSFACSGYCKPAELFSFNLSISNGRLDKVCRDDLKQEVYIIFSFPSIIAIIAAGTSAIAFTAQYWLWKEYKDVKSKSLPKPAAIKPS